MATPSDIWDAERIAGWKRLAELGTLVGLEQALCHACRSEESIAAISGINQFQEIKSQMVEEARIVKYCNDSAVFLALVGRGVSCVRSLDLKGYGLREIEMAALTANLVSNTNIRKLTLSNNLHKSEKGWTSLGEALRTNATLQDLHLKSVSKGSESVTSLLHGLKGNKGLVSLDLSGNLVYDSDEGIKAIGQFLTTNSTLKALAITETYFGLKSANHLMFALEHNIALETLKIGGLSIAPIPRDVVKKLLKPLSSDAETTAMHSSNRPKNTTLRSLHFTTWTSFDVEDLARMISTNKTLSSLGLVQARFSGTDWVEMIFPALKENEALEELDLNLCEGLNGLHDGLIDIIRFNNRLTNINLSGTDISSWQGRVDEELRKNRDYRFKLRGQARVQTQSGRLVLCGYELAGVLLPHVGDEAICKSHMFRRCNKYQISVF